MSLAGIPGAVEVLERPATLEALGAYAAVPIAFEVREVLECTAPHDGLGGLVLVPRPVAVPYVRDYDAHPDEDPRRWARRFDVSRWVVLEARMGGERVGGAVVAFDTPGVHLLEERRDLAVLWDMRVAPHARGDGVGRALFRAAERWAAARGCRQLKVETQNVNVPACRFYARMGCTLGAIHRHAYPELPHEVQLLWYRELLPPARAAG